MSAKGHVAPKMKCPVCLKLVAYGDDAAGDRWLRVHGPVGNRCRERRVGSVRWHYEFWLKKGLIPGKPSPAAARGD